MSEKWVYRKDDDTYGFSYAYQNKMPVVKDPDNNEWKKLEGDDLRAADAEKARGYLKKAHALGPILGLDFIKKFNKEVGRALHAVRMTEAIDVDANYEDILGSYIALSYEEFCYYRNETKIGRWQDLSKMRGEHIVKWRMFMGVK